MDCVLEILRERSPQEYRAGREAFLKGRTFYPANMLIARKSVFEAYATWLFDVLFELERRRQGNWKLYDSYQMRVVGFLSERRKWADIALAILSVGLWHRRKYVSDSIRRKNNFFLVAGIVFGAPGSQSFVYYQF